MNSELSLLLQRCSQGDRDAEEAVFEQTYGELKRIARIVLFSSRAAERLQPTVLLHEAFLKMPRAGEIDWSGRQHFFSIAARAMRRALIDQIRQDGAAKRLPPERCLTLEGLNLEAFPDSPESALVLDEILTEFERLDPVRARVAEMRIFGGMSHEEIGRVIQKSEDAAKKDWKIAKLWLQDRVKRSR